MDFYYNPDSYYYSEQKKWWEIVAANYDVYLTDGTLLFAKNSTTVGSLRIPGSEGSTTVEYGEGDYTNPLIDPNNVDFANIMQTSHTYYPGSVKWRGDPLVRPGTEIRVTDRNGNSFPFLICSLELYYDGGMYMVAECHGSAGALNKAPGIRGELKKIRGIKAVWDAVNTEVTT